MKFLRKKVAKNASSLLGQMADSDHVHIYVVFSRSSEIEINLIFCPSQVQLEKNSSLQIELANWLS